MDGVDDQQTAMNREWWVDNAKVGDRLLLQPAWRRRVNPDPEHDIVTVLEVHHCGCDSGVAFTVDVDESGVDPMFRTLDSGWFVGPAECRKWHKEKVWWRAEEDLSDGKEAKP